MFDDFFVIQLMVLDDGSLAHTPQCCCMACWQGEVRLAEPGPDEVQHAADCPCIGCEQERYPFLTEMQLICINTSTEGCVCGTCPF